MNDFLDRMTSRKWIGFLIVVAAGCYIAGGDSVVATMEGLPEKFKAFFMWIEEIAPYAGMILAYFGFTIPQGKVDAAKEVTKRV